MRSTIAATALTVTIGLTSATSAFAQAPASATVVDIEIPAIDMGDSGDASAGPAEDSALDLANIVQSAAKGVTTVQEAPAIVTVVTADEIQDRQFTNLPQLYDTVPGWTRIGIYHQIFSSTLVRGQGQAVQYLHDGLSLFDPNANIPAATRVIPMELVKRVEFITGPGGVLWGSNSLLGILNVITKDAEDIEGIETGIAAGDGMGDRSMGRAYIMAGKSGLAGGKLKLFMHGSVETYRGSQIQLPLLDYHGPLPQPNSANVYGPLTRSDQPRSMVFNLSTKVTYDKLTLRVSYPFGEMMHPAGLSGQPVREHLIEDERCTMGDPTCSDPNRTARNNASNVFDRYAVAEYRTRFAEEKAGITARVYVQQFVRQLNPLQVLAPSPLIVGGLSIYGSYEARRTGAALDGDLELTRKLRVLYGTEAFYEWKPEDVTRSRQGPGLETSLGGPLDLARIPLACPRIYDPERMSIVHVQGCPLTFSFPATRTVLGAYVNPQYRPSKKLILDAGARVQIAPDMLGLMSYKPETTLGTAAVYNFHPGWHFKLNYTQGFRPTVFNNTASNGQAVQIGGNPNLTVEHSDAVQAEVNARIWKGERRIRELSFRLDGSYTRLSNMIQVLSGQYGNTGDRGIASAEFLGKLYVQGGHRLELGYTWLRIDQSDKGRQRAMPEHWFDLATVFNLVTNKLTATSRLKVAGAAEDPNRLVEYRDLRYDEHGEPIMTVSSEAVDLVLDRLPPIAELSLGFTWTPMPKLQFQAIAYNALVAKSYQPDNFFDYEPHLEYLPNPYEGFRAYVSAMYQY